MSQYQPKNPTRKQRVSPEYYGVPQNNVVDLRQIAAAQEQAATPEPAKVSKRLLRKEARLLAKKEKLQKKEEARQRIEKLKKENLLKKEKNKKQKPLKKTKEKKSSQRLDPAMAGKPKLAPVGIFSWSNLAKSITPFVIIGLILILPFSSSAFYSKLTNIKGQIIDLSQNALTSLKDGGSKAVSMDFEGANQDFGESVQQFQEAQVQLNTINGALLEVAKLLPIAGDELSSAENILIAGENLAGAAQDLTTAFETFNNLDIENEDFDEIGITNFLVFGHSSLKPAATKIQLARLAMDEVNLDVIPEDYKDNIQLAQEQLPALENNLNQILSLSETLLTILGHESPKRYLLLFQNNREIRPTGGFIGSLALIDIDKGKVKQIEVPGGGVYDVSGNLKVDLTAPQPLHLVNPKWELQDANWWLDFPASAEKIQWFYEKSGGPSVDGIITLTPDVIEEMLKITGPIEMEEYNTVVDADNFYDIVQVEAEKKYDETQESKKIIGDLAPKLLDKIFSLESGELGNIIFMLNNSLQEKDILLYFNDKFLEKEIQDLGWGGEIKDTPQDYLSVVNTNIAGGKTDAVMEEVIEHDAEIKSDGSIVDTVEITRTHKGEETDEFTNVKNIDFLRLYVPQGSEIISAEGLSIIDKDLFLDPAEDSAYDEDLKNISGNIIVEESSGVRINNEFGKTVFGGWLEIEPGQSKTVKFSYRLPFKLNTADILNKYDSYSVYFQKQPGSFDSLIISNLTTADNFEQVWQYPTDFDGDFSSILNVDRFYGVVLRHK
ncbi:MAG: DUF4012 domain-containing protein [Patescibacteria group bacterium]|nr:DUF4012 domain-containing protein [Patescibacteria group bacterium]